MEQMERWTPAMAWDRMTAYCAYQERSHHQVRQKLADHGVFGADAELIIVRLIEENYLNESRFAIQYAGGHFRMKQWGRQKIKYGLQQHRVSPGCIKEALASIEEDAYQAVFEKLADYRWKQVARNPPALRWAKTRQYLLQKGFEATLVQQWLQRQAKSSVIY